MNSPDTPADTPVLKKPDWLKIRIGSGSEFKQLKEIIRGHHLHTVCEEALCPNMGNCWRHGRATIMILGDICSRSCRFCNVHSKPPAPVDPDEPQRVAEAIKEMGLQDIVITSVTRDDLPDGGSGIWVETIQCIRNLCPEVLIEVLVPDFGGSESALTALIDARPDVFGHNLETAPQLYPSARPQAIYARSRQVLRTAHEAGLITKTAMMLGLGETIDQIHQVMQDARADGVDIMYLGQYLQPTREHLPIQRYLDPEEFKALAQYGESLGFGVTLAEPLVRSSYHSEAQATFVAARLGR